MFKVGDRVAIIHLRRVGKDRRREAVRVDTVEKVTSKQITTNKVKFNAESGFQIGRVAPQYQIVPLTPEHGPKGRRFSRSARACIDSSLKNTPRM
jgi:hypothetical protein